jgi:FAD/FMN-containing dehydrogenase
MSTIKIAGLDGKPAEIATTSVEELQNSLRGDLLKPGDAGYDESRTIWNAMIDRKPALIAHCTGAADVSLAVKFASENSLLTSIRGGGHNIAGNAVCDDGFMIDLSLMKSVGIDPVAKKAHVGPGATLGDLDHESQAFGLATPVGINSTTGVAGLVLGGGFGWLSRKYGMTCDNLTAADVVLADGSMVRANEKDHPDLFWAIRGGGGNFGIVTRFEFNLHPVGPNLLSGLIVFSLKEGAQILKKYRDFIKTLGDDTNVWVVTRKAPPLPFLPEEVHGTEVLVLALCHAGDPAEGTKIFEPLRSFGTVLGEHVGVMPFTAWQQAFDPLLTPGARNYWKSHNFTELSDGTIEQFIKYASNLPSPQTEIFLGMMGGQVNRIDPAATAYAHRDAELVMNVHGRWEDKADDDKVIKWSRDFFNDTKQFASAGVYVNFMTGDEADRIEFAFGSNYEKLTRVKKQYDPNNLFRINHNIKPA